MADKVRAESKPLSMIPNRHSGPEPDVQTTPGACFEFENDCGERWVLVVNKSRTRGILRGAETAWEPIEIRDDRVASDLILGDEEAAWLAASWKAATGRELYKPAMQMIKEAMNSISEEEAEAYLRQLDARWKGFPGAG